MLNIKEVCDNDHLDRARWPASKCDLLDLREQRTAPDQPSTSSIFRAGPFDQSQPSQFSNGALLCGLADLLIGILVTTNALSSLLKTDFTALFYAYLAKINFLIHKFHILVLLVLCTNNSYLPMRTFFSLMWAKSFSNSWPENNKHGFVPKEHLTV